MGMLIDGEWKDVWYDTQSTGGRFKRSQSQFRHWITTDGFRGPTGESGFKAERDRYHLYASYACPWAHRVLIYLALKGLDSFIDVSFVHWFMGKNGWTFEQDKQHIVCDKLFNFKFLHQVYTKALPSYTGRVTVPILWDKKRQQIVSNESSDIIRMLNTAFDNIGAKPGDYYPKENRNEIDALNERIYHSINNGVYKCGFATSQHAYDEAIVPLFNMLDELELRLEKQTFLCGSEPLEADWRLFPTLFRFDAIYFSHFKCAKKRLQDYPNLWAYTKKMYHWPGISQTTNLDHARYHYFQSHSTINPSRIVPVSTDIDWDSLISAS